MGQLGDGSLLALLMSLLIVFRLVVDLVDLYHLVGVDEDVLGHLGLAALLSGALPALLAHVKYLLHPHFRVSANFLDSIVLLVHDKKNHL